MSATAPVRLVVDLDVVLRRGHAEERTRVRHALHGTEVDAVTLGPSGLRTSTFDVGDWQHELARTCGHGSPPATSPPPAAGLELPWDLLLGTGEALARHRPDLYDVLVARADGAVCVAGRPLGLADVRSQVRRLHGAVTGRLRCTGVRPASRRVGWLSWLRYVDGWRALTPYAASDGSGEARAMVRLEPRSPHQLAHAVAGWAVAR
jgi:hypothetical protein